MLEALERDGFAIVPAIARDGEISSLIDALENADLARAERGGRTFGARNLLDLPDVRRLVRSAALACPLTSILGQNYLAVRGLFFDKTPEANWPVLWHQDLSLAVAERHDLPGWENWSIKRGIPHVQPPAAILVRMITMRLHLDDCPASNGPLRALAGSHRDGILARPEVQARAQGNTPQTLTAGAGDALFMRPPVAACLVTGREARPSACAASGICARRSVAGAFAMGRKGLICCAFAAAKRCSMTSHAAPHAAR